MQTVVQAVQSRAGHDAMNKRARVMARMEGGQTLVPTYAVTPFKNGDADVDTRDRVFWYGGGLWIFLATGEETGGQYVLIENLIAHGPGPKPHIHEWQDEAMLILEGDFTYEIGDQTLKVGPGALIAIPRGTRHTFSCDSPQGRAITLYTQTGFERAVMENGTPATAKTLPPPDVPPVVDETKDAELKLRYGMVEID